MSLSLSRRLMASGFLAAVLLTGCTARPAQPAQPAQPVPPAQNTPAPPQAPAPAAAENVKIGLAPGNLAPNLVLTSVEDGKRVELRQFRGKVVLLNFWATTCPPCKAEMPDMERLQQSEPENLVVLAVGKENPATMKAFARDLGVTFRIAYDYGQAFGQYRITGIPTSYFIDQNGIISSVRMGAMKLELMQTEYAKAYAQGQKKP